MNYKTKPKIYRKQFYNKPLIITGLTRSGKTMLAPLISSFDKVEKVNVNYQFEYMCMLNNVGAISDNTCKITLQYFLDNQIYENMIGRNTNFRFSDWTSVWYTSNPDKYISRVFSKEGDEAFDKIKKSGQIFPLLVHDALWHANIYFKSFPYLKMIHIDRHPVDLIYSWYKKGYGLNFYNNPRNALLTLKLDNKIYPYYAYGWEAEYESLSEIDRIIKMVEMIQSLGQNIYSSLSQGRKKRIKFVKFEEIAKNPIVELNKIAAFVKSKKTINTPRIMDKEIIPRKLDMIEREKKYSKIKKLSNSYSNKLLDNLISQY
jgi:hypothetical protein